MEEQGNSSMTCHFKLHFLAPAIVCLFFQIVGYVTPGWYVIGNQDGLLGEGTWYYINCTKGIGCEAVSYIGDGGKFLFSNTQKISVQI